MTQGGVEEVVVQLEASIHSRTLKEGLEEYPLEDEILVKVLLEELKAYKAVRVDTGQERFNVICDLLDICSEGSPWVHERAFILVELAQVLCYHDYSEQTECSALDSINEALRLLEYVPKTPQNDEQLQDDKAQALLWLYICTVEDKMHEVCQRTRNTQGQKDVEVLQNFETNDLTYEDKSHDDKFLYLGIAFNLSADSEWRTVFLEIEVSSSFSIYEQIEEGLSLLVEILQNPALQRSSKVWYLLRASALQLTAAYLILPSSTLPLTLRQKLSVQGDNLVQKWQVLADMFVCSERFVSLLSKIETVSEAKAFCLETLKISMKVQSIRWCAHFLVLKSKLELQRNNLDLCGSDLEQVLFLLESGTVFETKGEKGEVRIKPKKGGPKGKKPESLHLKSTEEDQSFLKEACLEFIDTVPVQKTLTTSPVLRPKLKKQLSFLNHPDKCCCLLCSDVILSTICLRWLIISVDGELTFGNGGEGLHLLQAILQRCTTVAQRIAQVVAFVCPQEGKKVVAPCQSTIGLLDGLMAHIYVLLTKQSMNSSRPGKKFWQFLEKGLTFLSSKGPQLLELEYCRTQLLLARAVAAISVLNSRQGSYAENILSNTWSWKSPLPLTGDQEIKLGTTTEETFNTVYAMSLKSRTKKQPVPVSKSKSKRLRGAKTRPVIKLNDPFALADSDSDTPSIVLKPPTESFGTPAQKSLPVSKKNLSLSARSIIAHKAPFVVFEESSPKLKAELPKAPKVTRRMKSRIKILFSDDSDAEGHPEVGPESQLHVETEPTAATRRTGRRVASNRKPAKASFAKTERCSAGSSQEHSKMVNPQVGRPRRGPRRGKQEDIQKGSRERILQEDQGGGEEKDILKANKESSEDNIEVLRGSDEEKAINETRQQPSTEDQEILRKDFSTVLQGGFSATEKKALEDPFNLHVLASSLDAPADILSMDSVYDSLQAAFQSIAHYPLGALYNQLCQLMALCIGNRDPIATAYLVSESVSITLRHQKMTMIHKKVNKMKKTSVAGVSKELEALTLQEGKADSQLQQLLELQNVFEFSCPTSTGLETKKFRESLQEIPPGITVCIMTLVSTQPQTTEDILLLTRLEKDATPVNIQIQTLHAKVSLSAALSEFEAILQKQKEISNFTLKEDWWTGRIALDKRMMVILEPGWTGVVGEVPSTDQVPQALEECDLYIYAGHGAGTRFVDSILKIDCRAVAFLFGCSSAALAVQGNLEGTGAILKFIMAGCPLVLGNLWDVTDRDIDRYMQALLNNWLKAGSGTPLLQYIIESRQAPKLRYMIGAAPVAYGLPVFLK
ncbi:PREDICTED: separin [Thamnophis sirtalis]|uniref:separase n=1 Tax=Thamnophis sirtalis TaxID=35019 RepID=A0A6I9YJD4_9SAUR|nr:PREDICTED: separin [Thamnophis sirtalis]